MYAYENMGYAYRRLGQFETSLEFVDKAIRLSPHDPSLPTWYADIIVVLALTGHEQEAHEALQRLLALPGAATTMAAWKAVRAQFVNERTDPRYVEYFDRIDEGLRKAGLPED